MNRPLFKHMKKYIVLLFLSLVSLSASALNCVTNVSLTVLNTKDYPGCDHYTLTVDWVSGPPSPDGVPTHDWPKPWKVTGMDIVGQNCLEGTIFSIGLSCCPQQNVRVAQVDWKCDPTTCHGLTGGSFYVYLPRGCNSVTFRIFGSPSGEGCGLTYCVLATSSNCPHEPPSTTDD